MKRERWAFLKSLLATCTPSGFESEGQLLWKARAAECSDEVGVDVHGNVIAALNSGAPSRFMLAGHCDEIGLMVTHITENGFIHFASIGGVDVRTLPGTRVVFLNAQKTPGVIGKKPIHREESEERRKSLEIKDLWIDIGALNRAEATKIVPVGTPACITPHLTELRNGLVMTKAWDNKVGAFIAGEVLREVALRKKELNVALYAVSTVQEEIGSRGAITSSYDIDAQAGIAIDVGFATDTPADDKKISGEVAMGKGPILHRGANINIPLGRMLEKTARRHKIPVQMCAEPGASATDADMMQISRRGMATALVAIPCRYMHTPVEVCSLDDIDHAIKLITETVLGIPANPSFIPY